MIDSIASFSDLHAHAWTDFADLGTYRKHILNTRLIDAARFLDFFKDQCQETGITRAIFAGDLFHRKRMIEVPVFNTVTRGMWRLANRLDRLYVMTGNHDLAKRSGEEFTDQHALASFDAHKRIVVVDTPRVVEDVIGIIPYASERDTVLRGVEKVLKDGAEILFMHAGIMGAATGPVEYQPLEPLQPGDLPDMPIRSGHYHKPQTLTAAPNISYIGAPMEHVRGDACRGEKRGGIIIDANKPHKFERMEYRGAPRFRTLTVSTLEEKGLDAVASQVSDGFVDLVIDVDCDVAKYQKEVGEVARSINTILAIPPKSKAARWAIDTSKRQLPSVPRLCKSYVKHSNTSLDKKRLLAIAKDVLSEVESA